MLYHGNEAGMWGADDPDDRKPMMWEDLEFDVEKTHPLPGWTRPADEVKFDPEMFAYFQKLISIRNSNIALRRGDFKAVLIDDKRELYGFERNYKENKVIVLINNGPAMADVELDMSLSDVEYLDALTDKIYSVKNNKLQLALNSKEGLILLQNGK